MDSDTPSSDSAAFYSNFFNFVPLLTLSPAAANYSMSIDGSGTLSNFFFSTAASSLRSLSSASFIIGSSSPFAFASSLTLAGDGSGGASTTA